MIRAITLAILALFAGGSAVALVIDQPWVEGRPYDLSMPSDRRLQAFDKANPSCRLWTDWRKLCSRTGKNGATFCRTDPTSPVQPSTPFCASNTDRQSRIEQTSRLRFCDRRERAFVSGDTDKPTGPEMCIRYRSGRPFSGERIDQMVHPSCQIWGNDYPGPAICSTDPKADGLPSCGSREVRAIRRAEPFVCRKWKPTPGCRRLVGGLPYYQPTPGDLDVRNAHPLSASLLSGTYCDD